MISHWHPNITINIVDDHTPWVKGSVPPPLDQCEAPSPLWLSCLHLPKLSTLPHPCLKTPFFPVPVLQCLSGGPSEYPTFVLEGLRGLPTLAGSPGSSPG